MGWMRAVAVLGLVVLAVGCAPVRAPHPLDAVEFGPDEIDGAWGRAHFMVGRMATRKIQVVTDYVVETYNPDEARRASVGCRAERVPFFDGVETISVACWDGRGRLLSEAARRAMHFVVHGEAAEGVSPYIRRIKRTEGEPPPAQPLE